MIGEFIGMTVADVIERCGVDYGDLQLIDEPPGRLRAVRFCCPPVAGGARITLLLEGDPLPFSTELDWPPARVLPLKVCAILDRAEPEV
jgi:hypothetical protein